MLREQEVVQIPTDKITDLSAKFVLKRPKVPGIEKYRFSSILSPEVHPTDGPENLLERLISHRLALPLPEGSGEDLLYARANEKGYIYRRVGKDSGVLAEKVCDSSLYGDPTYLMPTADAIKHPIRTMRDILRRRSHVLVTFGELTEHPPKVIALTKRNHETSKAA